MATLNQAKIINALETISAQPGADFIYDFMLAYGTPKATINRLRMGDAQRNVATWLVMWSCRKNCTFGRWHKVFLLLILWPKFLPCLCWINTKSALYW